MAQISDEVFYEIEDGELRSVRIQASVSASVACDGEMAASARGTVRHETRFTVNSGAYRVDVLNPINPGQFGFFLTALAPSANFGPGRDIRNFDEVRFWMNNETGASFNLKFEVKDYRDSSAHIARRWCAAIPPPSRPCALSSTPRRRFCGLRRFRQ